MRRLLDGLYLGAGYAAGAFLVVLFLLMMVMSAGRQFGLNIPSGDDFAAWSMAALAFLGLAHTFKSGEMIRVGLLIDRMTGTPRRVLEIAALLIALFFTSYFAWHAAKFTYYSWMIDDRATGLVALPLWIPQTGYAGGLALLALAIADELQRVLRGLKPSYEKEPPKSAEEAVERAASSAV